MTTIARDTLFNMDTLFNSYLHPVANQPTRRRHAPHIDITEFDDRYQLVAELAGISKDDIAITVEDATLTITANRKPDTTPAADGKVLRRERQFGQFVRSFKIGEDIAQDSIQATFKEGLLYLTVPKLKEPAAKSRTIEIH